MGAAAIPAWISRSMSWEQLPQTKPQSILVSCPSMGFRHCVPWRRSWNSRIYGVWRKMSLTWRRSPTYLDSIQHYRFLAQLNVIICHLLIVLKVTRGMGFTNCFPTCDSVLLGQAALQAVLMVDVLPNFRLAARFFTGAGLRRPHCCRWLV